MLTTQTLILKIEAAALLSKLLKSMYDTKWCHNPEDHNLNTYHENLKTYNVYLRAIIFPQRFIIFDTNPQTLLEINFACKKFQQNKFLKLINSWKAYYQQSSAG
jgi:hypothetical protein